VRKHTATLRTNEPSKVLISRTGRPVKKDANTPVGVIQEFFCWNDVPDATQHLELLLELALESSVGQKLDHDTRQDLAFTLLSTIDLIEKIEILSHGTE